MKTKKYINDRLWANSYIEFSYFYPKLTEINVKTTIDLIVLSCEETDFKLLDEQLQKYYKVQTDHGLPEGNFKRKKVYMNSSGTIDLMYRSKRFDGKFYKPMFLFYLHQPSRSVMYQLDAVFKKLGIFPLVKKIELAWDFYVNNVWGFQEMIEQHLFLRHQRNPSRKYKNTFYTNDLRQSVKGVRVYTRPKEFDYRDCVRLELELHRPKIKNLGIEFPVQAHHLDLDFRNYFEFRMFDLDKIYKYYIRNNGYRGRIVVINGQLGDTRDLFYQQYQDLVRYLARKPLMQAVEILKSEDYGIPNYAPRCLAKTRKGTPCQAPRVTGKTRCRMHGAFAGRPKDPVVQMYRYFRMVNNHISKFCMNCESINLECRRIHFGESLPEDFKRRI